MVHHWSRWISIRFHGRFKKTPSPTQFTTSSMEFPGSRNGWWVAYNHPIGNIYHLYYYIYILATWVIIYITYHLLREPETTIESSPKVLTTKRDIHTLGDSTAPIVSSVGDLRVFLTRFLKGGRFLGGCTVDFWRSYGWFMAGQPNPPATENSLRNYKGWIAGLI